MGLSQADAARRLNVSLDFGINTNPKILCPEDLFQADHELQHLQKTVFNEGEETTCRSSLQTPFKHQEEESRYYGNAGLYARRPVLCVPLTDDSEGTAYAGQENMFSWTQQNGLLLKIYNGE
ncbi:hypothetical protein TNCV_914161 [Trichonephila clavipes]|nr:hypothetical protein TNCV_914161 [Trichonephila clavipes]